MVPKVRAHRADYPESPDMTIEESLRAERERSGTVCAADDGPASVVDPSPAMGLLSPRRG